MPLWPQFCGGSYLSRSVTLDAEATLNFYPATIESASNPKQKALFPTPGLRRLFSVDTESSRGLFFQDGRTWGVIGATLYEFDLDANTASTIGTIPDDGLPVSFASNGRGGEQLAICGGGELKIFDLLTDTLSAAITLPLTNAPTMIAFIDGFFLLLEADTVRVWFSALEDGESWDALDFFARSETSDNLVAMHVIADRIWLLGSQTLDIWVDVGDADTPFVPYTGTQTYQGSLARYGSVRHGNSLFWVAHTDAGTAHVMRASEGGERVISTDAITWAINVFPRVDDCEACAFEQNGHPFIAFTFPSGATEGTQCGVTYVWDDKEELWHQRASYDSLLGIFFRWRVRGVCQTDQGILVGDYSEAEIYALDPLTYTENGSMIRRVRRAPYLSSEAEWMYLDSFEVGVQSGVGLNSGQGSDPMLALRRSTNAGRTYGPSVTARVGKMGEYTTRAIWRKLGRSRADWLVIEVSCTDPVPFILGPGAWVRASSGSGAL